MNSIENILSQALISALQDLYHVHVEPSTLAFQKTKKEFEGDLTLVVFPFLKASRLKPEETAKAIGEYLQDHLSELKSFNVVNGFLNLCLESSYWVKAFDYTRRLNSPIPDAAQKPIVVEYSSPNTNKPLHLGHVRNNLLGWSVSEILKYNGQNVKKVNLVNDRGIHICKSMLAWKLYGQGETPASSGLKGDHLVGKYYVIFSQKLSEQVLQIMQSESLEKDKAENKAPLMLEAREMLRQWESGDPETIELWRTMNQWVYDGFNITYQRLGVDFDKIYYESQTYLLGKAIVQQGLEKGALLRKEDDSVWADLREEGLDEKLLLRKDGTSVYMTQDLGTAALRHKEWQAERLIYVVGNEQNYHFDVLRRVLKKLGYTWGEKIVHLSYGMVELPEGKMKSREGTVVDADELIEQMIQTAQETTELLGKATSLPSQEEREQLYYDLAMGALKYFLLKVDPSKNMLFNPKESIDFNGNTGPFIQYTHARIRSLLYKFKENSSSNFQINDLVEFQDQDLVISEKESTLIQQLLNFSSIVKQAAQELSPALIANYLFDLSKTFNGFYQDTPVLKEANINVRHFRLALSQQTGILLKQGLHLLGISAPERM